MMTVISEASTLSTGTRRIWRRRIFALLAGLFAALGIWQIGQSALLLGKAWLAPILIESAWAKVQAGETGAALKPWPWADTQPVAKLHFPTLERSRIALSGATPRAMAFGPTFSEAGPIPAFFGHRDTHFTLLRDVGIGDPIRWESGDGSIADYRIREAGIRHKDDIRIAVAAGEDLVAFVTCWPFDAVTANGPMRYVVIAEREIGPIAALTNPAQP